MKTTINNIDTLLEKIDGIWTTNEAYSISHLSNTHKRIFTPSKIWDIIFVQKIDDKHVQLLVNNKLATVKITKPLDDLLAKMGLDNALEVVVSNLKSPMPGLIVKAVVKPGDIIEKGEPLIIIEAMKMENVLKAPAKVEIASIHVVAGEAVDKGALLISFV